MGRCRRRADVAARGLADAWVSRALTSETRCRRGEVDADVPLQLRSLCAPTGGGRESVVNQKRAGVVCSTGRCQTCATDARGTVRVSGNVRGTGARRPAPTPHTTGPLGSAHAALTACGGP